jgi:hypothetical protein
MSDAAPTISGIDLPRVADHSGTRSGHRFCQLERLFKYAPSLPPTAASDNSTLHHFESRSAGQDQYRGG